jgi:hypothetical protein
MVEERDRGREKYRKGEVGWGRGRGRDGKSYIL